MLLSSQKMYKRRECRCVYTIYHQTPRRHLERATHINWLSSLLQYTLSDSGCHGKWVMMRQLANGLMGNEGAGSGNWWLDAELHSIHHINAVQYAIIEMWQRQRGKTYNPKFAIWHIMLRDVPMSPRRLWGRGTLQAAHFHTPMHRQRCAKHFAFKAASAQWAPVIAAWTTLRPAAAAMRWQDPCKVCWRCSVEARPGRSLHSTQRCWQCRRVFSLVCSTRRFTLFLYFKTSVIQQFSVTFLSTLLWFFPFCVLYVWCTLLIVINSDWRQAWLPVSKNVSPRKPNIAPLGTSCPRSAVAVPDHPWSFQKVKYRDNDPSDVTTVVSTSCNCRHSEDCV